MAEFEGRFADYLEESDTPSQIEVELGDDKVVLDVPTRKVLRAYYAVLGDEESFKGNSDPSAFERAQWEALIGKKPAKKVLDYFDDRPFTEYRAFRAFVDQTWFGKGADQLPGK